MSIENSLKDSDANCCQLDAVASNHAFDIEENRLKTNTLETDTLETDNQEEDTPKTDSLYTPKLLSGDEQNDTVITTLRHLKTSIHPDVEQIEDDKRQIYVRHSARAVVLNGEEILMLYTERYDDYTIPGGGLDDGEAIVPAMIRELQEETGAKNIRHILPFGIYEEYRPWYKNNANIMQQISYIFCCDIDSELGATALESHEVNNGMKPVWINIHQAIAHNEKTIRESQSKGMSIERETYLLKLIATERL